MKHKHKTIYTESSYLFGLILLAFGTAMMEKSDFGMSMVVAPAYLLHLKLSRIFGFFTFGMAEYVLQLCLLILLSLILKRFRLSYLISFATAVLYGFLLDLSIAAFSAFSVSEIWVRLIFYFAGMFLCAVGIAFLFHTYIPPEAYELFVKELSAHYTLPIGKCKTAYDCISCAVSVILSFCFFGFGRFEGIGWGTILCALINGRLINICSKLLEKQFVFSDGLDLRKHIA